MVFFSMGHLLADMIIYFMTMVGAGIVFTSALFALPKHYQHGEKLPCVLYFTLIAAAIGFIVRIYSAP